MTTCRDCTGRKQCEPCKAKYNADNIVSKVCPGCVRRGAKLVSKPPSEFNRRRNNRLSSYCKDCNRLIQFGRTIFAKLIRDKLRQQKELGSWTP